MKQLVISENLNSSSRKHLYYLLEKGIISHKGEKGSTIGERTKKAGDTGLYSGEVIGYSTDLDGLFLSWLKSPLHNNTILDSRWSKIGISVYYEDNLYIAVINFSSGILYSTYIDKEEEIYSGYYIEDPFFKTDENVELLEDSKAFYINIVNNNFKIIRIYNKKRELMDIVEVFF